VSESFWQRVAVGAKDECWPWTKAKRNGYGRVWFDGKVESAHRVAYALHYGFPAFGKSVCHSCDNPSCCNPAHLWIGTPAENSRDMARKRRAARNIRAGESHPRAKLTEKQVLIIRRTNAPVALLASHYGVSRKHIYAIRNGVAWSHL
jgi:hypothetical protein